MSISYGSQSMVASLQTVVVKRPEEAFRSDEAIDTEWRSLGYLRRPDFARACEQHRQFTALLRASSVNVLYLPADERTGMDSLYTHDPVLITEAGAILLQTGKLARRGEGPAFGDVLESWNVPVLGTIESDATAEAGDMIWLDRHTLLVGRGFRTNGPAIDRLSALLQPLGVTIIPVPLPYWHGSEEVLHLMSFMSLLDDDLAVVYRRMLPVPLFELLTRRKIELVDVPDTEFDTMGANVLAVSPRHVAMIEGNPVTRSRLEMAGCTVQEIQGSELCIPGAGGPTCLTRPLLRV